MERKHAEAAGAKFLWPRFTKAITETAVELTDGEVLPADTVIMAVGDQPDLGFLPEEIKTERGFIAVDERFQRSDPQGLRRRRRRASGPPHRGDRSRAGWPPGRSTISSRGREDDL